jgi:hypothetical protein
MAVLQVKVIDVARGGWRCYQWWTTVLPAVLEAAIGDAQGCYKWWSRMLQVVVKDAACARLWCLNASRYGVLSGDCR